MGFLPKPMKASELLQFLACKTFESSNPPSHHPLPLDSAHCKIRCMSAGDSAGCRHPIPEHAGRVFRWMPAGILI